MGLTHLWDTNTSVYYLQKTLPEKGLIFIDNLLIKSVPAISAITEMELLCWKTAKEKDIVVLKNFISDCMIFEVDSEIKEKTVEVRKIFNLKLPDAIVAATAIVNQLTLISRNGKDFRKVGGLKFLDPFQI